LSGNCQSDGLHRLSAGFVSLSQIPAGGFSRLQAINQPMTIPPCINPAMALGYTDHSFFVLDFKAMFVNYSAVGNIGIY
jgi:hypothetical protein